jgi:UDP-galactopyranose mutase
MRAGVDRYETLLRVEWAQPVAVVNYPMTEAYTCVTEYKHLTEQRHPKTGLTYEYASCEGEPYYPVPRPENEALYKHYQALADIFENGWFVGRLGTSRYDNVDQVVGQALATLNRICTQLDGKPPRAWAHAAV